VAVRRTLLLTGIAEGLGADIAETLRKRPTRRLRSRPTPHQMDLRPFSEKF
jgi:hypothetical protein